MLQLIYQPQIPVAMQSKAKVWSSLLAKIVGSNPAGDIMFVMSVVCCHIEVSVMSWSLIQRSPIDSVASLCVIYKPQEWGEHGPSPAAVPQDKTIHKPSLDTDMFENSMSIMYFVDTNKDSCSSKYMLWTHIKIFNSLNFNKKHVRNWEHKQ